MGSPSRHGRTFASTSTASACVRTSYQSTTIHFFSRSVRTSKAIKSIYISPDLHCLETHGSLMIPRKMDLCISLPSSNPETSINSFYMSICPRHRFQPRNGAQSINSFYVASSGRRSTVLSAPWCLRQTSPTRARCSGSRARFRTGCSFS